ncbi:MAG: hypothetical protein PV358_13425, partial [Acidimicrobiales bacterium]|nr:hypothetical protein [Acidimicrobiales bacterium]
AASPGDAHRTAFAALRHSFEKVGDRWEPKSRKGPSDPQAAEGGGDACTSTSRTYGGVDVEGRTKDQLVDHARRRGGGGRAALHRGPGTDPRRPPRPPRPAAP